MTDTLYFASRETAESFAAIVIEEGHRAEFMPYDPDASYGYNHGVAYTGPEVTPHSTHRGSETGRWASRFLSDY
jgi:hypothetical protein